MHKNSPVLEQTLFSLKSAAAFLQLATGICLRIDLFPSIIYTHDAQIQRMA